MSRMAIPTMDVIRFKENDIIVASGGPAPEPTPLPTPDTLVLANFNDGTTMDGDPLIYFVRSLERTHGSLNVFFKYNGSEAVRAVDLLSNEENNTLCDGHYIESHNESDIIWTWLHQ